MNDYEIKMSTAATSSSSTKQTTFLLSEWIRRAVDEVDLSFLSSSGASSIISSNETSGDVANNNNNPPLQWTAIIRNSMALCSDEYLISALRVAWSLADLICEAEDFVTQGNSFYGVHSSSCNSSYEKKTPSLPAPGNNWADRIQVHLSSDDGAEVSDILNKQLHFNIDKADFVPSDTGEKGQIEEGMRRIHSLGVVFYQIFSGGERPAELLLLEKSSVSSRNTEITESWSQETLSDNNNNCDRLPFDHHGEPDTDFVDLNDFGGGEGDHFCSNDENNPRKRQTQSCHYTVYDVSVEPLRAKCLPRSLCDLVANMIGCAHDTPSSGEESYHKMSEVRDDLQLMLDKPAIYLYDQDMGRLATTGLQFGDRVFGRNAELSTVKDAYRRWASGGGCELVIISGASGYGKSLLAYEVKKHVIAGGGIVLSGKFDQLQQGEPFSALASAFDVYCGILLQDSVGPSSSAEMLASKVRSLLGSEAYYLTKLIPNLATILVGPNTFPMNHNEDCDNAQKRLQYLLCQFLEVISITFSAPVTLFLDDLQWADPASIEAVNHLLLSGGRDKCFFFLGCCREGAINKEHPVWKLLRSSETFGVHCTNVMLDLMDEQTVNIMVSETLCLSPRLTSTLSSIIYHKTKGNPLFVSRLMLSLCEEGLLRPSLSRRRWEWDKEKIENQKLPDTVAMFLNNSIRELPEHVQSSLCVLSCFGASADVSSIRTLEKALDKNILDDLNVAVAKGLLDKIGALYRFSHDRIQEATYNMMPDQARRLFHFSFGLSLASLSIDEGDDGILFIAVNQLNHGGPAAVQDPSQSFTVADMNLRAGKKAIQMADFKIASSYFDHGISFLRNNHWMEHYDLSLELFELAAKCALTNGDHDRVKLLYEQVLTEARSFEDKLDIAYTNIRALFDASCLEEALTKVLYVLNEVGVVLSEDLMTLLPNTKSMLAQYSDEQLLSRPVMTDRTKLMAMKFLSIAQLCLFHTNPKSQPKATLQVVQYSLRHGMSGLSSVGFVFYGSFLACQGEIPEGYRYVKIAIKLAEKMNATDCMGDVLAVGSQVMGYIEPLQSVNDVMIRGHEYGLMSGNISSAMLSLAMSIVVDYWSGKPLSLVKSTMDDMLRRTSSKSTLALIQTLPLYRSALAMIGNVDDISMIIGTEEERKMRETTLHLLKVVHFNKMYVGFMFRSYNEVKQLANAYDAIASLPFNIILISDYMHLFYGGLINFWIARKTGDAIWFERGQVAIQKMRSYANCSSWNFKNKLLLLQAEQSFHLEDFESAKVYYDDAISHAQEYKFVHEEALACELAGYFLSERGDKNSSLFYFLRAQRKYHEWGAYAKEESLKTYIQEHFGVVNEEDTESDWELLPRMSAEPRKRRS